MNKKTKSFAVGLVAVLCFLLVFAIGFGVTGAWYQAQRQASGTVKMDQGIYLKFTNLKELNAQGDLTKKMEGQILDEDGNALNSQVVPAQTVTIQNPTITGGTSASGQKTVDFYVRAKVTYSVKLYTEDRADIESTVLTLDQVGLTEADLVGTTGLKFNTSWVAGAGGWSYLGSAVSVAGLTKVNADAAQPYKLFEGDATSTLTFVDWTAGNATQTDPSKLVEMGGPTVTYNTKDREVAQVVITIDIQVIQAQNMTDGALETATWKAA